MYCVENTIKKNFFAINGYTEIGFIQCMPFIGVVQIIPVFFGDYNSVGIVLICIQIFVDHVSALYGNMVFAGIAAHYNGNVFFHLSVNYHKAKIKKKGWAFLYLFR